ncbi:unnamed protein product [Rhizophagus irregularis]|nr:unnamed protein product [Rhizophagus irregularis]
MKVAHQPYDLNNYLHNFGILFTRSLTVSSSTALRLVKETLHHGVNLRKFVIIPHRRLRILTSKIISGWT